MAGKGGEQPLRKVAEAFEALAYVAASSKSVMQVGPFSQACANLSIFFSYLDSAFKFAENDYVSKVDDLMEASKSISTLRNMIDLDIQKDCVRQGGSHTRNLLRVKRGLNFVKIFFEQIIQTKGNSLKEAATLAYAQAFAPYHGWAIRKAVGAGFCTNIPSKSQVQKKVNEDEVSMKIQMQRYVETSEIVIKYIDELFNSRQLGLDW